MIDHHDGGYQKPFLALAALAVLLAAPVAAAQAATAPDGQTVHAQEPAFDVPTEGAPMPATGAPPPMPATIAPSDGGFGPCPADLIREAFARPLTPTDLADLLALEKDTLTLCAERGRRIAEVIKNDREIATLRAALRGEPTDTSPTPPSKQPDKAALDTMAALFATTPADTVPPAASGGTATIPAAPAAAPADIPPPPDDAPTSKQTIKKPAVKKPQWFLRSVYGSNDDLTAGIADAAGHVFFVKPGDRLPDGSRLGSIRLLPTRVTLTMHGKARLLPREHREIGRSKDPAHPPSAAFGDHS